MNRQSFKKAFTMIELIFVIIILGILAATALPKFVGIQDDAKISAEKGVAGGVRGGIAVSHGKWLLRQGATNDWDSDGVYETFTTKGYLANIDTYDTTTNLNGTYDSLALTTGIFAEILSESATDWKRLVSADSNISYYTGTASDATSGVANEGYNDINKSGKWTYNANEGSFTFGL